MHSFDDDAIHAARAAKESTPKAAGARSRHSTGITNDAARLINLQRAVGNAGVVQLLSSEEDPHGLQKVTGGGGSPLDTATRVQMESAIGADFSDVRVHTGGDADQSARSLGAHAYTSGSDVVFADGKFDPWSTDGQRTLAHELTHVVQQRSGPVEGEMTDTGIKLSNPSDRHEQAAEANAERVVSGASVDAAPAAAPAGGSGVQREAEEDEVQALHVQRDAAPEEEEPVQTLAVQREPEEEEMAG